MNFIVQSYAHFCSFLRLKVRIRKLFGFLDVYIHALWCWFWFVLCGIINCPTNGRHQWLLIAPSTSSSVLIQSTFMWTYMMIDFQIPLCQSHKNVVLEWLSQLRAFCDVQNIIAEMLKHRTLKKEIKRCEWIQMRGWDENYSKMDVSGLSCHSNHICRRANIPFQMHIF